MSITCVLCGNKQSSWLSDFSLTDKHLDKRICIKCNDELIELKRNRNDDAYMASKEYLKECTARNEIDSSVKNIVLDLIKDYDGVRENTNAGNNLEIELERKKMRERKEKEEKLEREQRETIRKNNEIMIKNAGKMLITTGVGFDNYTIIEYLGIVSSESIIGTGIFSDTGAQLADFFGISASGYESKFRSAENTALAKLKMCASSLGANAIIAIDIDVTTFAGNIIGVMTNGTAVKIREIPPEQESIVTREIPVINYSYESVCRIGQFVLQKNLSTGSSNVMLRGVCYNAERFVGVQVKVELISVFGNQVEPIDLDFIDIEYSDTSYEFSTNLVEIKGNVDFTTVGSVRVILLKYINHEDLIIEEHCVYEDIKLRDKEISKLKFENGVDAITKAYEIDGNKMICFCGTENDIYKKRCKQCGRRNVLWRIDDKGTGDILMILETMNTGKDVASYILSRYDSNDNRVNKFRQEMLSVLSLETPERSFKDYVIKKYLEIFVDDIALNYND